MRSPLRLLAGLLLCGGLLVACSQLSPNASSTSPEPGSRVYHVQLRLTEDKGRAAAVVGRAEQWWNDLPSAERPPLVSNASSSDPAVHIEWKAPYYRVRLGPFATEQEAQSVLEKAQPAFPKAFVVPAQMEAPS